ncbi:MAG: sigma-70 family RNA polymerase sigma factor [Eubacterium sp.]|nr:sigma-70 family RNA polymerase sigma factor [Eubacterium sp.]
MVRDNRDSFIESNLPLVHSIANRFRGRGAEYDDLFQAGCLGLIKAADNFDESLGYRFSTYAVPVIMGEIRRIFRDGGQIKVSRSLKEKSAEIQSLREDFITREQREPTVSELASLTGTEVNELSEILNIMSPVISLSVGDEAAELDLPVDDYDSVFDKISLNIAISKLDVKERMIVRYRYFEGRTQCDTAKRLGISQVQVSRKEKDILKKLRLNLISDSD